MTPSRTMKTILRITAALITAAIISACCPKLYHTERTDRTETVKEIIRDTLIQVQPDSSIVQALIRCDSTGRARLEEIRTLKESSRLQQTITARTEPQPHKPTLITVKAKVDSMAIYLTYKDRLHETTEIREVEKVIEKQVNILKWWQKFLMWVGVGAIILLLLRITSIFTKIQSN